MGLPSSSLNQSTRDTLSVLVGGEISQGNLGCGSKQKQNLIFAYDTFCRVEIRRREGLFYLCECISQILVSFTSVEQSKRYAIYACPTKTYLHFKHKKWCVPSIKKFAYLIDLNLGRAATVKYALARPNQLKLSPCTKTGAKLRSHAAKCYCLH
jgi:hypothetical protein